MVELDEVLRIAGRLEAMADDGKVRSQLAEEAGISGSTLRHAINGGRNCGIDVLLNLSRAMDVRPWDLVREMGPVGGNR